MSEIDIPDHEYAVGLLAVAMVQYLFSPDPATTAGEELLSLPKADALLVVLAMTEARVMTEAVCDRLTSQVLKAVDRRRQHRLREVLDKNYGVKDERF